MTYTLFQQGRHEKQGRPDATAFDYVVLEKRKMICLYEEGILRNAAAIYTPFSERY